MIAVFKVVTGVLRIDPGELFEFDTASITRGHNLKIRKARCRLGVRQGCFSNRIVNDWNALPAHVISSPTVNTFKSRLDALWCDVRYALP